MAKKTFRKKSYRKHSANVPKRYHHILPKSHDRDKFIFEAAYTGKAIWVPALGAQTDGFEISANAMAGAFIGTTTPGTTQMGLPITILGAGESLQFDSLIAGQTVVPGLQTAMSQYQYYRVDRAVLSMVWEQDTIGGAATQGTTQIGVVPLGFTSANQMQTVTNVLHNIFPGATPGASFGNLKLQKHSRYKGLECFAAAKTKVYLRSEMDMDKFLPPSWRTSASYWGTGFTEASNPPFGFQPTFKVQLYNQSDVSLTMTFSVQMKIKFYVTCFSPKLTYQLALSDTGLVGLESKEESKAPQYQSDDESDPDEEYDDLSRKAPAPVTLHQPVIPKELQPKPGHVPGLVSDSSPASSLPPGGVVVHRVLQIDGSSRDRPRSKKGVCTSLVQ